MSGGRHGRIVVGVGPAGGRDAALEYALAEAVRRDAEIHLVLVMHERRPGADGMIELKLLGEDLVRVDQELLVECEQWLSDRSGGDIRVTTEIAHGSVAPSLAAAARRADLVVLQHHRMARPFHVPTLSVTNGVASRCDIPVVAVPDHWHEDQVASAPVLAAVVDAEASWNVAETAFEEAQLGSGEVRLTRAWSYWDDLGAEEATLRAGLAPEWERYLRDRIEREFRALTAAHPKVRCETRVEHGQPAYVLVTLSSEARLVVIGRHHPALPIGSHLGPVTRAVLTRSECPVMVVDTQRSAGDRPGPRDGA
ncbi:MAG: universal stress protein [Nocardioides sp.]